MNLTAVSDKLHREAIRIVIVAAVGDNRVLGSANRLPWRLKTDLRRYKAITMGKPVIMGRKTYESIGRPLPGRETVVLTRDASFAAAGVLVARSPEDALETARERAVAMAANEIIIGGGEQIYALFLPVADVLRLTHVHASPDGDAWFPRFDAGAFHKIYQEHVPAGKDDSCSFDFTDYERL
jgi:dihydrofolate reductase